MTLARRTLLLAASLVLAAPSTLVFAQAYPDRPVKLTVGFPPGTGARRGGAPARPEARRAASSSRW